jgi:WD40 repeat protein/DNA-binding SARP family transcriptional activator
MDLRVLGPVEASVDEREVAIGAGKPRALLAMLALNEGSPVSAERLIDGLWGEEPPATAPKMVQVYVSQLRKALAGSGNGAEIVTRGRSYELRLGSGDLDVRRFERLVAEGAPRAALALWRGPPLDDVAGEPFAALEIRRLEELRLAAIELAIEHDLAAGRHHEVIGELEALVAEEPLRERLHAQRMLALYRCGRQADALDAYRQARTALVDAIGVEPGPELRRLHEAILRQDPALDLPAEEAIELPLELDAATPLVGREDELASLREHRRHAHGGAGRVVLIAGARGMGKTRLAAELADEVHRDGGAVRYASGAGSPDAAHTALQATAAARRPTLLVLDDVDQAPEEVRALLDELACGLAALPVLVLATAEDACALADLHADAVIRLGPLDLSGVATVARLYAREDAEVPVEQLAETSGGVPQRVHRAAAQWARADAARRLSVTAARAASERSGLRTTEDDLAGDMVELQAVHERSEARDRDAGVVACPFKGLASFDVEDADMFFGRERLVARMVARLAGAPLMAVVGPSGSGKSSALRAGLLAALRAGVLPGSEGWPLALLRPGEYPLRALEQATVGISPESRMILAVDQFEEVFTACRDEHERSAFVDALVARARDPRRRALVLVAIRADFYGRCAAYAELSTLLDANHVLVGPMRRDELRRAIELPAQRAALHVEPDLVDALIADVRDEPGALPLLSTTLLELWEQRDGRRMRMHAYEQAGGVRGAVARLAERAYERLDPDRRDVARRILLRLAGGGEGDAVVRRRVPLDELHGEGVAEVLDVLADDRLVTIGEGAVEVAHEALLREWPRLRGWLEEDVQGRRLHHQLRNAAREWDAGGRDPGELYRGARLASTLEWAADHDAELNAGERGFLGESRAASERSERRVRGVLASVAALLVLAVAAGVVALDQRGSARDEATAADAQRLGSRALVEEDFDRALLLARQGVALDDTVRTRGNLLAALLKGPAAVGVMRVAGDPLTTELSPDDRTLAVGTNSGEVRFFDTRARRHSATLRTTPARAPVFGLAYSPDGRRLAVAHGDIPGETLFYAQTFGLVVVVVDVRTRRTLLRVTLPRERPLGGVRFSPDGRTIDVTLFTSGYPVPGAATFTRFDAGTGRRVLGPVRVDHGGRFSPALQLRPASPVLITSDGRRMVVAEEREITVRDSATGAVRDRFGTGASDSFSTAYALSRDDRTLAIGSEDGSVRFLDLRSGRSRPASGRHAAAVTGARFTADGRWLVTTADDGTTIVWDVRKAAAGETLSGQSGSVFSPRLTRDGRTLYTASLNGTVFVWDLLGSRRLGRPFKIGAAGEPRSAVSADGRLIAIGQYDGAISIVDARTLRRREPFPVVRDGSISRIAFVPGSHLLVVGSNSGFLALVDADRGRVVRRLPGHRGFILTPGLSADGRLLVATGTDDDSVRLWSLPDGRQLGAPLRFPRMVYSAQLSPDGRWLAIGLIAQTDVPETLEIWDVRRRRRIVRARPAGGISHAQFSPDGRLLVVLSNRGTAQLWSTSTWKPVGHPFVGHAGALSGAAFSRDGRTLATGSVDGTVRLWDIPTQQAIGAPLPGLPNQQVSPSFMPDGTRLLATYGTGRAYLWDIGPDSLTRHACAVAGRQLTRAEWREFLPSRDYDPAC